MPADYNRQVKEGDSARPKIIGAPMNQWTSLREQGIDTNGRRTQLQVPKNGASYGVKFKVEATYLNKPVKATVVMADGEEATCSLIRICKFCPVNRWNRCIVTNILDRKSVV